MRALLLTILSSAAATAAVPPLPAPAPLPVFDPLIFFAGRTEGRGVLKVVMTRRQPVAVHGRGRVGGGGTITLDQTVIEGDKPATDRRWTFRPLGGGRYGGTLTDATGPVAGEVTGNRLHLHFHVHHGVIADQWLDLAADGQSARNRMTFHKLGVVVARLDETIRKEP